MGKTQPEQKYILCFNPDLYLELDIAITLTQGLPQSVEYTLQIDSGDEASEMCEEPHLLVPSLVLSLLLLFAIQISVEDSMEQKGMDLKDVHAVHLCHFQENAATATMALEQRITQQLCLLIWPAVGSPMPSPLSQ